MVTVEKSKTGIQDFGVKLGGARKDRVLSAEKVIHDDEIANMTLSQIWPKSEIDDIKDIDMAALATAIRAEIPAKPRQKYKLDRWVDSVKLMRWFMQYTNENGFDPTIQKIKENRKLLPLTYKVNLLRQLPREHWNRIEEVNYYPNAQALDENRKPVTKPFAEARVDGRYIRAESTESLERLLESVRERLNVDKQQAAIRFEIRGYKDNYSINKKGDPLYRKLKTFTGENAIKEARAYMEQNKPDLIKAWEGVKEAENVKETDVRRAENRPRVGSDYRRGRDATPEMFMDAFGFRGVEFGNWVSQGANLKERQGMLNAAYDALMDLAKVIGISPRWISLNGALGLGLGSRGSGSASAHYEPDAVVINLTKTRGAGTLAHEWFHAVDNYFQKKRGSKGQKREDKFITFAPGAYYFHKGTNTKIKTARFKELVDQRRVHNPDDWELIDGIPAELSSAFDNFVTVLDKSPMKERSRRIDKGQSGGYWGRVNERASRAFENYIIAKMISQGFHNDYLANVVTVEHFKRDPDNYPYLLDNEIEPVSKAFDDVFEAIKKHEPEATAKYEPVINKPEEPKKEPWLMSKSEWVKEQGKAVSGPSVHKTEALAKNLHRNYVKIWLSEGKPVSPEVLAEYPELNKTEALTGEELKLTRIGKLDETGGNYFGIEGLTQYEGGESYILKNARIADTTKVTVADQIIKETLKDKRLNAEEIKRLNESIGQGGIDYMLFDETPMSEAAKNLGYDAVMITENQDYPGSPSSVFVINKDKITAGEKDTAPAAVKADIKETKEEAKARIKKTMTKYHSGALVREVVTKTEGPVIDNTGHLTQEQLRNKTIESQNKQIDARHEELRQSKIEAMKVKSKGHVGFYTTQDASYELFKDEKGDLFKANVYDVVDTDTGYRIGRWEAPANMADSRIKVILGTPETKKEAPMVKVAHRIIENSPDLKVKNLGELPHGTGAAYLEVIESHIPGEYIAVAWRRKVRENEPGIFIKFDRTPRGDTSGPNVKGWQVERSEYNDYQTLLNQYQFQIGEVTDIIRANIKQMLEHHPVDWVSAAIQKAADDKKKSWGPIKDLIFTWDENGKPNSIKPIPALEDKEPETVKAGAKVVEKGRESYTEKDDEDYYTEFAEPREGTAPGRDEYKDVEAPAVVKADIKEKKEEVAPAMKAEIKASIKEGKAIDKSAEAAVKEAEKIIEQPPEPAIRSHLKTMSFEDRMMYREVVERRLEDVQRMAMEMASEALAIREYMNTDPIATFRAKVGTRKLLDSAATKAEGKKVYKQTDVYYKLTDLLSKTGEWPETLSKKQANLLLMGRTLKPTSVNAKGRVPWEYVLDELASIFGISEQELINHVENIAEQKARLRDMDTLVSEAADREKELRGAMEELQKLDNITGGAPTEYIQPVIKQTPGEPEAGMQKGMFGEDKEVRPQGKGKVTQINLMEYGKLQEIKEKVKKPADLDADIMAEVSKLQEKRSPRSVAGDNAQTARNVVKGEDVKKWLKHPERFDIRGVDTKRARRPQRASGAARVRTSR